MVFNFGLGLLLWLGCAMSRHHPIQRPTTVSARNRQIHFTVVHPDGHFFRGVRLEIVDDRGERVGVFRSNRRGVIYMTNLPSGPLTLTFRRHGFNDQVLKLPAQSGGNHMIIPMQWSSYTGARFDDYGRVFNRYDLNRLPLR